MKLTSKDKIIDQSLENKLTAARELADRQKYQEAIEIYRKVLFLKQNIQALVELAQIYQKIYDVSSAILFYKRAYQVSPEQPIKQKVQQLCLAKGLELLAIGSCKNIMTDTEFSSFHKRYHIVHKKLHNKAYQLEKQGEIQMAEKLMSSLAYLQTNQRKMSLEAIQEYLALDSKDADVIVFQGLLNWSLMENKKGYECFWEAWRVDSNNEEVKIFIDMVTPQVQQLYKQSKYDLISKDFVKCRLKVKKALEMYPNHIKFLILSSFLYRAKQQYQEALGQLEAANKVLDKNDTETEDQLRNQISLTYNQMGVYLFKHAKYQEAIKLFSEGLSYKPKDWGLYCNRGDCYKGLNDYVKALEDYHKAHEIEPRNQDLNFRLASIYNLRGIALFNSKNFEHAIKQFSQSIRFCPRCVTFYFSKAKCLIQLGLKAEASTCLAEALKVEPNNPELLQLFNSVKEQTDKKLRNNRKVIVLNKEK